jgi:hypothetical protein
MMQSYLKIFWCGAYVTYYTVQTAIHIQCMCIYTKGSQKVPGILWHWLFGALRVRTTWTVQLVISTCKFCRGSGATGGKKGQWFLHRATHRLLCHHPTTVLSGSSYEWLMAVPYSENGPKWGTFRNQGGYQIECYGKTPENSKRSLPPVFPSMEHARACLCVRARVLLWRQLCKCMSYHYSAIPSFRELFDCSSCLYVYIYKQHTHTHIIYIYIYIYETKRQIWETYQDNGLILWLFSRLWDAIVSEKLVAEAGESSWKGTFAVANRYQTTASEDREYFLSTVVPVIFRVCNSVRL